MSTTTLFSRVLLAMVVTMAAGLSPPARANLPISQNPLYLQTAVPPLNMLVMGRDHKLYYEAYNDASDLNGDGVIDVGYKPDVINYFGYFSSNICYTHDGTKFNPSSYTANKKCSGKWSGDFLNYLTTTRIDALRKVLYGGNRSTDSATETVLQRAFVPQDAHSWGKEYESVARDGYNITEYANLPMPQANRRHLMASTTLADNGTPILRVLQSSDRRIWEWVSIERAVAGDGCVVNNTTRVSCVTTGGLRDFPGNPNNRTEMDAIEATYAITSFKFGGTALNQVDCDSRTGADCNPYGRNDQYLSVFRGDLKIANNRNGTYQFYIDGDDAVDMEIRDASTNALMGQAGFYGAHSACDCNTNTTGNVTLGSNKTYRLTFRHVEDGGDEVMKVYWRKTSGSNQFAWTLLRQEGHSTHSGNGGLKNFRADYYDLTPPLGNSSLVDYAVRVAVCPDSPTNLREPTCKQYPTGHWKPTGVLHDYGETDRMSFGLITGSQGHNLQGGVLRRNMGSITTEINPDNGVFYTNVDGVIQTLNEFRAIGFTYGTQQVGTASSFDWTANNCSALGTRSLNDGECRMWGNPIAEMMFEAMRYFAGATGPVAAFATSGNSNGTNEETAMGLKTPAWKSPYARTTDGGLGFKVCAKPVMTVISDINPSYDGQLPGSAFGSLTHTSPSTITPFNAQTVGSRIWNHEFGGSREAFIGQSGSTTDGAPTPKTISSFGNIRGLSPEEPTKEGTYYSAAVAHYGWTNPIYPGGNEELRTYAVALASPLPRIEFPVGGRLITLVPFAKTVGGAFSVSNTSNFQPTNTIVDFYIEKFVNLPGTPEDPFTNEGRGYAKFRINYEDVEQGNDHDMDAIVNYEVLANEDGTVSVRLRSEYAAGSATQHAGYVISGTTADGVYLDVVDLQDGSTTNPSAATFYKLNTPQGLLPGDCNKPSPPSSCNGLPIASNRIFTVGADTAAILLRDPLWYAAKYGSFNDKNGNLLPDGPSNNEWDENGDGRPDNYFLVTNALTLREQLNKAFSQIERDSKPTNGVAASGTRKDADFLAYVPYYNSEDWTGDLVAYELNSAGALTEPPVWTASELVEDHDDRDIFFSKKISSTQFEAFEFTDANLGTNDTQRMAALGLTINVLNDELDGVTVADAIEYLRGNQELEGKNGGTMRDRSKIFGDILNSQPEVLTRGSFGYTALPASMGGGLTEAGSYGKFITDVKRTRRPVVFVGSNDGMLHAFDGGSDGNGGKELFSFIPNGVLSNIGQLIRPGYTHRYFVDGSPLQGDVYVGGAWKTMLLFSTGLGGKSVVGLDVTDAASSFGEEDFMWEFQHAELGLSVGQPRLALIPNGAGAGKWVALIPNGLNSTGQDSSLFVVDAETGALITKVDAGTGTDLLPNGMTSVVPVDSDGDGLADIAYAGDYQGSVWRFNLSGGTATLALAGQSLYRTVDAAGVGQPITGGISVGPHHVNGQMVYFGTGRYLLNGDNEITGTPQVQTFYGVWDKNDNSRVAGRTSLQAQTIVGETSTVAGVGRRVSANAINWTTQRGFYLDLKVSTQTAKGEQFIGRPRVELGKLLFTTFQPLGTECEPGGTNRLYVLTAVSGAAELPLPSPNPNDPTPQPPCADCGGIEIGDPGPPAPSPPVVTTPPEGGCRPGIDPGCDLPDPLTPGTPTPVSAPGCISNLGVLMADGVTNFAQVSCGRQAWRQLE